MPPPGQAKPEPGPRQAALLLEARAHLSRGERLLAQGKPFARSLLRKGLTNTHLARVLARYGSSADEFLALKYLPYNERATLIAYRKARGIHKRAMRKREGTE